MKEELLIYDMASEAEDCDGYVLKVIGLEEYLYGEYPIIKFKVCFDLLICVPLLSALIFLLHFSTIV